MVACRRRFWVTVGCACAALRLPCTAPCTELESDRFTIVASIIPDNWTPCAAELS